MKIREWLALLILVFCGFYLTGCTKEEVFHPTRLSVGDGQLIDRTESSYYPRYSVILPPERSKESSYSKSYSLADIPRASYDLRVVAIPQSSDSVPAHWGETVRAVEKAQAGVSVRISEDSDRSSAILFEHSGPIVEWKTAGSGVQDWHFYKLTGLELAGKVRVDVAVEVSEGLGEAPSLQVELVGGGKRK